MRKQTSRNEDWIQLWNACTKIVSAKRLDELEADAVERAHMIARVYARVGYGWSGGKDSVVLANILQLAKLGTLPHFCSLHAFEYPSIERWLYLHAPRDTQFIRATDYDVDFLNENPRYLFPDPTDKKVRGEYTKEWRKQEKKFCRENGIDVIIAGRRIEDGNACGQKKAGVYTNTNKGTGITSCNLIAEWTHAELLAYIKSRNLPLPMFYAWPNGFVFGTHAWTERDRVNNSINDTFDEVFVLDDMAIKKAASKGLRAAQEYLAGGK